jgi:hypothetical protein
VSSKRRRKRPSSRRPTARASSSPAGSPTPEPGSATTTRAPAGGTTPSPFPGLGVTLARGLRVVGSSPAILATAFLGLLATWATFVVLGAEASPRFLAVAMAISPANLFTDVPVAFSAREPELVLASVAGLAILRAATFSLLISLIDQGLEGTPDLRTAVRRLPRAGLTLMAVYLVEVGVVVVLLQLVAGFLGQLSLLVVAAAIYFLAFVPVVAVLEGDGVQAAFRRGARASRLPGTRHLTLVLLYFLFLFYAASISPFGPLAPATPTVLTWAFGLAMTFLHTGVLGGLVYRWLAVRDQVPVAQTAARARP